MTERPVWIQLLSAAGIIVLAMLLAAVIVAWIWPRR